MTDYARLKSVLDTLVISYTEVVFTSDYRKQLLVLGTTMQFVFDNNGNYVEYKKFTD